MFVNKICIFFQNKKVKIATHVLLIPALVFLGYLLGRNINRLGGSEKASGTETNFEVQVKELKDELDSVLNDQGQLMETGKQPYKKEQVGIYSPLIEDKEVDVSTYKYRGKFITHKSIIIDDRFGIEIWEYDSQYNATEGPEDFAIFTGYENYNNKATSVEDIKNNWKESYRTRNGFQMFYEYDYSSSNITALSLGMYQDYIPNFRDSKPMLISVRYKFIDEYPVSKDDQLVLKAVGKLKEITDTLTF